LSVICSKGIPIYSDDSNVTLNSRPQFDDFISLSWESMGKVLETAAEQWFVLSKKKLSREEYLSTRGNLTASIVNNREEVKTKGQAFIDAQYLKQNPLVLAKKTIMLLETLRLRMGAVIKKTKRAHKTYQGLGPRIIQWNIRHIVKWASSLDIIRDGRPISSTSVNFIMVRPDIVTTAIFDKRACKSVFCQVSQQTRLRSIFSKYDMKDMKNLVKDAGINLQGSGDIWFKQPSWWGNKDDSILEYDFGLLHGMLCYGFGGFNQMLQQTAIFCRVGITCLLKSSTNYADEGKLSSTFTRLLAQERANQLTREISGIDENNNVMRIVSERKKKRVHGMTNTNISVNDDLAYIPSSFKCGVQKGIDAFFRPSCGDRSNIYPSLPQKSTNVISTEVRDNVKTKYSSEGKRKCSPSKQCNQQLVDTKKKSL